MTEFSVFNSYVLRNSEEKKVWVLYLFQQHQLFIDKSAANLQTRGVVLQEKCITYASVCVLWRFWNAENKSLSSNFMRLGTFFLPNYIRVAKTKLELGYHSKRG